MIDSEMSKSSEMIAFDKLVAKFTDAVKEIEPEIFENH